MEALNEIWPVINSIGWFIVILVLIIGVFLLYKFGKYREFNSPDTKMYEDNLRKRKSPYQCPYDIEGRSCKDMNCPDGYIDCKNCDWYGDGVRPSKF